jgi:hypothetical protein
VIAYPVSFIVGFAVCFALSMITGKREAWDSGLYFSAGIPVMCAVIAALSYTRPDRPWRWTLAMAVGQSLAIVMADRSLSLWPLSIMAMLICSIPQFLAGKIASIFAAR